MYMIKDNDWDLVKTWIVSHDRLKEMKSIMDKIEKSKEESTEKMVQNVRKNRELIKGRVRELAIQWQNNFGNRNRSWEYCMCWHWRFKRLAKKYKMLREFRQNGIL